MESAKFQFKIFRVLLIMIIFQLNGFLKLSTAAPVISSVNQAMMYLQKYGYLNESTSNSIFVEQEVSLAIKDFQHFAGLSETGQLDLPTLTMMNTPRCGMEDPVGRSTITRKKRYALQGSKWRTIITYNITSYPQGLERRKVDEEIAKAFKIWSDVTNFHFKKTDASSVNIKIRFEKGEHGDNKVFDGPGQHLAHAFYPHEGSDVHFDDDELWTIYQFNGTNLFQVAAHEFGHSLGLLHSNIRTSIMNSFYRGYDVFFGLDEDDIMGIQALYGRPLKELEIPMPRSRTPDIHEPPDLCEEFSIDAFTMTEDRLAYMFEGEYYWEVSESGVADGYPRRISLDWDGLPGNLDAALKGKNGHTFFFKRNLYWSFRNKVMDSGYPKEISVGFPGIPDNIDAAFIWSGDNKMYFFKGRNYWKFEEGYEPPVRPEYPKLIRLWKGLPSHIDAAIQWSNRLTYFFKGRKYYKYNDSTAAVDKTYPPYPRSSSDWWLNCKSDDNID